MRLPTPVHLSLVALIAFVCPAVPQTHSHSPGEAGPTATLGQVVFPTSCAPQVQEDFDRAVAMLHSFWYRAAERAFTEVAAADRHCTMAYWGIAMSRFHQLWERPGAEDLRAGQAALATALEMDAGSPRERRYIEALELFYRDVDRSDDLSRKRAYETAMERLYRQYRDDPEAAIFYALSLLGTAYASPADESYERQKKAGALLETVLASQPEHPGVAHYIIHSYDYPPLAERALVAARRYASIAPDAPHAQHMPSHIFTRLGLWRESIASNRAAAASARRDGWTGEELHASDYLTYAHLQNGQIGEAQRIVERLPEMAVRLEKGDSNYAAGIYALAAIPARFAIERRRWQEAAALEVADGLFPGGRMCWVEATLLFARGLGEANTGSLAAARRTLASLAACRDALQQTDESLWAHRVTVQWRAVAARVAAAEGRQEEALALLRSAAELEDSIDKPPITPGSIVPARELLGELLLELEHPGEALLELEAVLHSSPNRLHALHGAALAAGWDGESERSRDHYASLASLVGLADADLGGPAPARATRNATAAGDPASGIEAANARFAAVIAAGDAATLASLYTEEAQLLPPGSGVVTGRRAIEAFWQDFFDHGARDARLRTVEVIPMGEHAIEVGSYAVYGAGGALLDRGKTLVVWKAEDGHWRLHRGMWNSSRPLPTP